MTVSALNNYVANLFLTDENLQFVMVQGELSNFKRYPSGHCYFSVKDSESVLKCVMFAGFANKLKTLPKNGEEIIVAGCVELYERNGEYQLKAFNMLPVGAGELQTKQEQLKDKLEHLGMFRRKRPLPFLPKKIGVITSTAGSAVKDILNILERRYGIGEVVLFNALVQGSGAEESIAQAINKANTTDCDVLIIGRGGGSKEDLAVFDTEKVAFAIFNSDIPTISAVGHETDFSIADMVADLRAPTPSAAAELVAPSVESLKDIIARFEVMLNAFSPNKQIEKTEMILNNYIERLTFLIKNKISVLENRLAVIPHNLEYALNNKFSDIENNLEKCVIKLEALNPLKVLKKGYSVVYKNEKVVSNISELNTSDIIKIQMQNGCVTATVGEKYEV
jgi:exodeoxyribonuclease VII large subunit